jgi:hypothetical protein
MMLDGDVALCTLHVPLGDVDAMHQGSVLELVDALGLVVAVEAAGLLGLSRSVRYLLVAGETRDQVLQVLWMVNHKAVGRLYPRDLHVAPNTTGYRFVSKPSLEMAQETGLLGDGDMVTLHHL